MLKTFFCLLLLSTPVVAQNYSQESFDCLKQSKADIPDILKLVICVEKPSLYQEQKIIDLYKSVKNVYDDDIELKKKTIEEQVLALSDLLMKKSATINNFSTTLLKNMFPEAEGQKAKGTLDCDSLSIFIKAIMGSKVELLLKEGHVIVLVSGTKRYVDPVNRTKGLLSDQDKFDYFVINNNKQLLSLFLSNLATELQSNYKGNVLTGGNSKSQKTTDTKEILTIYLDAISLNNENIAASKNALTLIENMMSLDFDTNTKKGLKTLAKSLQDVVMNVYVQKNRISSISPRFLEVKMKEDFPQDSKILSDHVGKYESVRATLYDFTLQSLYSFDNYDQSLYINSIFLKSKVSDEIKKEINSIQLESLFLSGKEKYPEFIELYNQYNKMEINKSYGHLEPLKNHFRTTEDAERVEAMKVVIDIISGNLQPEDLCGSGAVIYGDVVRGLRAEHWPQRYITEVEVLRAWEGYRNFREDYLKKCK